jgi:hypothetical protein
MMTRKKILTALSKLGTTPEEVRQYLAALGYRGERQLTKSCPIALFLQRSGVNIFGVSNHYKNPTKPMLKVMTNATGWQRLFSAASDHYFLHSQYPVAKAVSEFIIAFDASGYPELILEGHDAYK